MTPTLTPTGVDKLTRAGGWWLRCIPIWLSMGGNWVKCWTSSFISISLCICVITPIATSSSLEKSRRQAFYQLSVGWYWTCHQRSIFHHWLISSTTPYFAGPITRPAAREEKNNSGNKSDYENYKEISYRTKPKAGRQADVLFRLYDGPAGTWHAIADCSVLICLVFLPSNHL